MSFCIFCSGRVAEIQPLSKEEGLGTKCYNYFFIKFAKILLQNASSFLLQNATVLLQNVTVSTKCDSYYKMRR